MNPVTASNNTRQLRLERLETRSLLAAGILDADFFATHASEAETSAALESSTDARKRHHHADKPHLDASHSSDAQRPLPKFRHADSSGSRSPAEHSLDRPTKHGRLEPGRLEHGRPHQTASQPNEHRPSPSIDLDTASNPSVLKSNNAGNPGDSFDQAITQLRFIPTPANDGPAETFIASGLSPNVDAVTRDAAASPNRSASEQTLTAARFADSDGLGLTSVQAAGDQVTGDAEQANADSAGAESNHGEVTDINAADPADLQDINVLNLNDHNTAYTHWLPADQSADLSELSTAKENGLLLHDATFEAIERIVRASTTERIKMIDAAVRTWQPSQAAMIAFDHIELPIHVMPVHVMPAATATAIAVQLESAVLLHDSFAQFMAVSKNTISPELLDQILATLDGTTSTANQSETMEAGFSVPALAYPAVAVLTTAAVAKRRKQKIGEATDSSS